MKKKKRPSLHYPLLIGSIALPLIVGIIGSAFTIPEIPGWYADLQKPFFNPPNWVFGPVWTVLYILQGLAFYFVIMAKSKHIQHALLLFFAQLILNLAWSIFFFGLHQPMWALFEIMVLWLLILANIYEFRKHSRWAAYLLVPYLAWVTFAMILNAAIVSLN